MKINLKRINDDYLFKATNDRGHEIVMDNKTKEEGFVQGVDSDNISEDVSAESIASDDNDLEKSNK
jgi:hypothetical protein